MELVSIEVAVFAQSYISSESVEQGEQKAHMHCNEELYSGLLTTYIKPRLDNCSKINQFTTFLIRRMQKFSACLK